MSITQTRKRYTFHHQYEGVSTLLSQQEEDFLQSQQQSQPMENATVQSIRSCHPPSTFHQWTFIFLLLITSLPHHPVYKRLPFCITPPSTSLLARWDAACFMNHLIRPTRSSNLVSWILVFLNTGKVIEPNKVTMFKKKHFSPSTLYLKCSVILRKPKDCMC